MNVTPGEKRHFVTMRVTKKNELIECVSFNPMAFHAGKSKADRIEVKPMVCENIRTIGSSNSPSRMLLSGFFSSENGLFWKCFPASPEGYFGLLPLMVFPMPMLDSVTYLGDRDTIAVELVFLLSYLTHQHAYFLDISPYKANEISELILAIIEVAMESMNQDERSNFAVVMDAVRTKQQFASVVTEVKHGNPVQLDLW